MGEDLGACHGVRSFHEKMVILNGVSHKAGILRAYFYGSRRGICGAEAESGYKEALRAEAYVS